MWNPQINENLDDYQTGGERREIPLHNSHLPGSESQPQADQGQAPDEPAESSDQNGSGTVDTAGTWGERDIGIPNRKAAMKEFEHLRSELSVISKSKSHQHHEDGLLRILTGGSARNSQIEQPKGTSQPGEELLDSKMFEKDIERQSDEEEIDDDDSFELGDFIRQGRFERHIDGKSGKRIGVVWENLTVKGAETTSTLVRTLPDAILGTFGLDLYNFVSRFVPALRSSKSRVSRTLIHDFSGVVRDGEMMLVIGRPGAGCTTFLKAIANDRKTYTEVLGEVSYGEISASKQKTQYRGEVNYNAEDDTHLPALTVGQTLKFSLMNKTKKRERENIPMIVNAILKIFGIAHTKHTLVGNEYIRGVSGGERKRVSIAETISTKSAVVCWDNSTRGLDSSTALDFVKSLRIMTDISNRTTLVALYQAGENIYELMDKVMVIDEGRCVFQGPAKDAKNYFIELGYQCPDRETTADFLASVTDPRARQFRKGHEHSTPKTPDELEKAFRESHHYQSVLQDIEDYRKEQAQTNFANAKDFEEATAEQKSRTVQRTSNYTVSFTRQVMACTVREFWLLMGDKTTLMTRSFIIIAIPLLVGSLFYGQPLSTDGAFSRGGSLIFSLLFVGWLQMTELIKAVTGRNVIARHKEYAFYRPSAVSVARVVMDFPIIFIQVSVFTLVIYFVTGLDLEAGKFWIYFLFVFLGTMNMTALFRLFASISPSINEAVRFSGISLNILIIFAGYIIPKSQLLNQYIWFGWIYYVNPISFSFEAVLSNEFGDRIMTCAEEHRIPRGPGIDPAYQSCSLTGSRPSSLSVSGADYLEATFSYSRRYLWRDFGILLAFTVGYIVLTAIATEIFSFSSGGGVLVFKKTKKSKLATKVEGPVDVEKILPADKTITSGSSSPAMAIETAKDDSVAEDAKSLVKSRSIFTWKNIDYSIPHRGRELKLLNNVSGFAKPGQMVALLGASGAGKTTLLNALSQRNVIGVVTGEIHVDGRQPQRDFRRGTGYCEQMDLHDGSATVREALEFSALLRQDRHIPRTEKIEYVDRIIAMLELTDLEDAIISSLALEQRKRLTIGVELAAKPALLLFLDEPTSGLDSNSAFNIIRFLKKLTAAGQAIVCTIHQPSSLLIQQFDMILALNHGGNVFYFGPVGENGADVVKYFGDRGSYCPPGRNVAEFIIETAAKPQKRNGKTVDWNLEWAESDNLKQLISEIDHIKEDRKGYINANSTDGHEYAATMWTQTVLLTKRVFTQHWRDPSYLYSKIFVSVMVGIANGFTFYNLGDSIQDMQNRMFSSFTIIMIPATIVNGVLPKFYQNMALWQGRELPSRTYGWVPFVTAVAVAEIPMSIVLAVLYWVLWYLPTGMPRDASSAGYVFLMTVLVFLFQSSWGQWIGAFAPSFTVISNILPFFFVVYGLFNGVMRPYSALPSVWRYTLYYLNPSTYWIAGVLGVTLHNQPVVCKPAETVVFNSPPGQTCQTYAGTFASSVGGYLLNPDATAGCMFCPFKSGDQYLTTLSIKTSDKWRNFGVFLGFCFSNWALIYFFVWTVRIKKWKFGFGYIVRGVNEITAAGKGILGKAEKKAADGRAEDPVA